MPTGRDIHVDTPLSNIFVEAFDAAGDYVAQQLFPVVSVGKQSDKYYTLDKDSWLLVPNTARAPKTKANRVDWKVSSDSYYADNYALAGEIALEDLANQDNAIRLRENTVRNVVTGLLRDYENRTASVAISNVSSVSRLTGASAWDAVNSADIVGQVGDAHLSIFQNTGLRANTLLLDYQSYLLAKRNLRAFEFFKFRASGPASLNDSQLMELFQVDRIVVARSQKNNAKEGGTASLTSIWGPTALLARVEGMPSMQSAAYGASFRWTSPELGAPMAVTRAVEDGAGSRKVEIVEAGYYQDEKVVASALGFYINTKSGNAW